MTGKPRHAWERYLGPEDAVIAADYAVRAPAAHRPALLLVDLYNKAFGDERQPIAQSRTRFPSSCGEAAWDALPAIEALLSAARAGGVPVVYSTSEARPEARIGSATRRSRRSDDTWSVAIVDRLTPRDGELVVYKNAPSAFFGTSLSTHLRRLGVHSVVLAGETTSGCVRATAVDASSHGFEVIVVEDACFDRFPLSHAVSLFDLHLKYGVVAWSHEVVDLLAEPPLSADPPGQPSSSR